VIFHMFTHVSEERVALNFGVANPEDWGNTSPETSVNTKLHILAFQKTVTFIFQDLYFKIENLWAGKGSYRMVLL
jgi:hypothetical protein